MEKFLWFFEMVRIIIKLTIFDVFKLDFATQAVTKVENLGNRAFFLGHNSSVSIEASVSLKWKSSHMYFTDDYWESYWGMPECGGRDMGNF